MPAPQMLSLEGQCALVTGASSGIGAAVALGLGAAGARVGVVYRSEADEGEAIAARITAAGGDAFALRADVAREQDVLDMFEAFVQRCGRIDILIANAGLQRDAGVGDMSLADWSRVIDVNLTGQFLCMREAIRRFRAQAPPSSSRAIGKIVCMSSVHEVIPWAGHVNYAASKGGVSLLMKSVAQEVAPERIRVNSIAPGAIRTPINRAAWSTPEAERKLLELIPYGRVGEPEDIANAAVWLVSDFSDYVTGATLFVDGGMTLYPGFADNG
ncbi:MAG TPA: glucose 1-dehydrogenase [Burkholderiales bacterium]|nr:glucose 1-dehydrogenase [Burkholderiales bacterium]